MIPLLAILLLALPARAADPHAGGTSPGVSPVKTVDAVALIDRELDAAWKKAKVTPSAAATDDEFLRRATLDILGRIPTLEEIEKFRKASASARRPELCDRLVEDAGFAQRSASIWSHLLLDLTPPLERTDYSQRKLESWLRTQFKKGVPWDRLVSQMLTANVKDSEGEGGFLAASTGERTSNPRFGARTMEPATNRTMKLFMGARVECAQCHNNFFDNRLSQQRYWELNAFFRQTDFPEDGVREDKSLNAQGFIYYQDTAGENYAAYPRFLDGSTPDPKKHASRRHALAHFITHSEEFPKALVNRYWEQMFGVALNGAGFADDISADHPVKFPELMDGLANTFRQSGFQPKELVRWLCKSKAYGLSSVRAGGIEDEDTSFQFMPVKRMTSHQLSRSLPLALRADPTRFRQADFTEAIFINPSNEGDQLKGAHAQKLALMNSPFIGEAISSLAGKTLGESEEDTLETYYRSILGRSASETERAGHKAAMKTKKGREDVIWALLNSSQFILNR